MNAIKTLSVPVTLVSAKWNEQLLHCGMVCAQLFLSLGSLYTGEKSRNTPPVFAWGNRHFHYQVMPISSSTCNCNLYVQSCWHAAGRLGKLSPCSAAVAKHEVLCHGPSAQNYANWKPNMNFDQVSNPPCICSSVVHIFIYIVKHVHNFANHFMDWLKETDLIPLISYPLKMKSEHQTRVSHGFAAYVGHGAVRKSSKLDHWAN